MISPDDKKKPALSFDQFNLTKCADSLLPVIIQDSTTLKVLMLGYMNREAFDKTLESGRVTFFSRSRQCLWTKGETSGNFLEVVDMLPDCDADTLLIKAVPAGPVCHRGTEACFDTPKARDLRAGWHGLSISAILICPTIPTPPACLSKGSKRLPRRWAKKLLNRPLKRSMATGHGLSTKRPICSTTTLCCSNRWIARSTT